MFHLALAWPTRGHPHPRFVNSLTNFQAYFAQNRILPDEAEQTLWIIPPHDSGGISPTREAYLMKVEGSDATHLLWVDDDMRFSVEALGVMARRDLPIVGANYRKKAKGQGWVALAPDCETRIGSGNGKTGVERCFYSGFGFMLMKREAWEKLPLPRFQPGWNSEHRIYSCDDIALGNLCVRHGVEWYVDHDATKLVRHVGGDHEWGWESDPD